MKIESLLEELDLLTDERSKVAPTKPQLEQEIEAELSTGELTDERAESIGRKRTKLELVAARVAQVDRRIAEISELIKGDFEPRFLALNRKASAIENKVKGQMLDVLRPFVSANTEFSQSALDPVKFAIAQIWPMTHAAQKISSIISRIRFRVDQGDIVGAARNIIEPEYLFENFDRFVKFEQKKPDEGVRP